MFHSRGPGNFCCLIVKCTIGGESLEFSKTQEWEVCNEGLKHEKRNIILYFCAANFFFFFSNWVELSTGLQVQLSFCSFSPSVGLWRQVTYKCSIT